jgi:anhydro-N-acetylmuramic acid kinase
VSNLYIGLISGTSVDGIDAALVRLDESSLELVGANTQAWDADLARRINALIESSGPSWHELGTLHIEAGRAFAAAALALLEHCDVAASEVAAIGHHGQTVHHAPVGPSPFTIQIGDPNTVAARTGITTVADLRGYDMAVGGQGAPLVPAFHDWLLRSEPEHRVVLNIGGIANITTLCPNAPVRGCDTGPGNTLLDAWVRHHRTDRYDDAGNWAAQGAVSESLLATLLADPWFELPAPKSTGRELFNPDWLDAQLAKLETQLSPVDVQATLAELTAVTISDCINRTAPQCERVIVCGGGAFNDHLMGRLSAHCTARIESSAEHGVAPDWVEALAFAWLARARLLGLPGNVPSVTGAHEPVILGGIYSGHLRE